MTTQVPDPAVLRRNRISLVLVFVLFASPVIVAWLLFFVFPEWVPTASSNHGTLVKPVRPLPAFHLPTLEGKAIERDWLQGKWTFVYLHAGACEQDCVQQLYKMRQIRLTQGKNLDRLQRLMLWQTQDQDAHSQDAVGEHFPGQVTALLPATGASDLIATFATGAQSALRAGNLYLVDPMGNLMMVYAPDDDPGGVIRDLERLLKYSGLG